MSDRTRHPASKTDASWTPLSPTKEWKAGEVELWFICLDSLSPARLYADESCLSSDEQSRLAGIQSEKAKVRFSRNRRALRQLLADYLDLAPSEIDFRYGDRGKPMLDEWLADSGLNFSIAHSRGYAAFAFCKDDMVGIDLELIRRGPYPGMVADRFYSKTEIDWLRNFDVRERCVRSLSLWCRKEALAKALGWSIMDTVGIDVSSVESMVDVVSNRGGCEVQRFSLRDLHLLPGYACSIAVTSRDPRIRVRQRDPMPEHVCR